MFPFPPHRGERKRVHFLIRELRKDFSVTLLTRVHDDLDQSHVSSYREYVDKLIPIFEPAPKRNLVLVFRFLRALLSRRPIRNELLTFPSIRDALRRELSLGDYEIVQLHHTPLAEYLQAIPKSFGGSTVINLHNVETLLMQRLSEMKSSNIGRLMNKVDAGRIRRFEAENLPRFDQIHTVSDDETGFLKQTFSLKNVLTIPNGIDWLPETPVSIEPNSKNMELHLLFCGSLKYPPNEEGALWFIKHVMPILRRSGKRFFFNIVGHDPSQSILDEAHEDVIVHGYVDDLEPFYRDSVASVIPLFHGGGTRHKALESLTYCTPIISTRIGVEGIGLQDTNHYWRAETAEEFAQQILSTVEDREGARSRVVTARNDLQEVLSWNSVGAKLRSNYKKLILNNSSIK